MNMKPNLDYDLPGKSIDCKKNAKVLTYQKSIFDEIPDVKVERKIQDTNFKHYKKFNHEKKKFS